MTLQFWNGWDSTLFVWQCNFNGCNIATLETDLWLSFDWLLDFTIWVEFEYTAIIEIEACSIILLSISLQEESTFFNLKRLTILVTIEKMRGGKNDIFIVWHLFSQDTRSNLQQWLTTWWHILNENMTSTTDIRFGEVISPWSYFFISIIKFGSLVL